MSSSYRVLHGICMLLTVLLISCTKDKSCQANTCLGSCILNGYASGFCDGNLCICTGGDDGTSDAEDGPQDPEIDDDVSVEDMTVDEIVPEDGLEFPADDVPAEEMPSCDTTAITCGASLAGETTIGVMNVMSQYDCMPYSETGGERVYGFTTTEEEEVTVDITTGGQDLDLVILTEPCNPNTCLDYSADTGASETISFTAAAGTTYYIVVDGFSGAADNFSISVTCGPELPPGLVWVSIPAGTFEMGCSPGDTDCFDEYESPRHTVNVPAFEMTETEITQAQYEWVIGANPSYFASCGASCPVEQVNWHEAKAFCEAIGGRLPSEAEWEYAARAGTTTRYYCGDDSACLDGIAWYNANSGSTTHPVGGKTVNGFGLFDMIGNVYEWVEDCWHADYTGAPTDGSVWSGGDCTIRVLRGGSWFDSYEILRVSKRSVSSPDFRDSYYGFRCARN